MLRRADNARRVKVAAFTTRPVIMGTFGVVAAGHYLAAAIGMRVLESGGNAIDAGVAAGFALNLVKPQSNGIGGEAPILIYRAGLLPATVPAAFGAWVTALMRYGRLGLKETLGPVVDLARGGFAVYGALRDAVERNAEKYRQQWPSSAEIYLDGGKVPAGGRGPRAAGPGGGVGGGGGRQ